MNELAKFEARMKQMPEQMNALEREGRLMAKLVDDLATRNGALALRLREYERQNQS